MISVILGITFMALKALSDIQMKFYPDTWKNKYDSRNIRIDNIKSKWYRKYHEFFGLKTKEKFLFSATLLVFMTDEWHLYQLGMVVCVVLLVAINTTSPLMVIVCALLMVAIFHSIYTVYSKNRIIKK